MPSDPVELTKQIKAASDIVTVVGAYLTVKPAGAVFKALCPFHNDSRPSLDVDPRRQRYKCWVCDKSGDVIAFVQAMEKVDFREARQILANRAGIKLDEAVTPQDQHRSQLVRAMKWAQERYQRCLQDHPVAANARDYLAGRHLTAKTVQDFGLGFAPIAGDWLVHLGMGDRVPAEVLAEVGLIAERMENRGYYDRFRDRVMFPIRDVRGQCVAFGGRIMPESPLLPRAPKYYNSAETPLFRKSDVLYGLDLARHAGASVGYLAVVEGYTDVMMAHQCGVPQVVATMGTALNASHVAQLRRYAPKVVLVYDADAGGMTGVDRALEIFVSNDVELAVATLPDGLDPCDLLVRPGGVEAFQQVLRGAVDALDFKLNRLLERDAPGVEATRRIVDEVLGTMAAAPAMPSQAAQVKRELIVTRLAHRLGLRQETVWARLGELTNERRKREQQAGGKSAATARSVMPGRVPADSRASAATAPAKTDPVYVLDVTLLRLLLADPGLVPAAAAAIRREEIQHTGIRRVVGEMYDLTEAGLHADLDHLRDRLADRPELYASVLEQAEIGRQIPERDQKLDKLIGDFRRFDAERQQKAVAQKFKAGPLNEDEAKELFRQLQQSQTRTAG